MKLLIITQKVDMNDGVLGFFHGWLEKLSAKADLFVVANYVGEYKLPENVKIFSLGKEKGVGKFVKFLKYRWLLLKLLPKSDGVFFHMCPEYVIGAGLCPKIFRKKTLLWYAHKSVNWKLKLAEKLVDKIFTASKESFRLPSKKVEITGHGIEVEKFKAKISNLSADRQDLKPDGKFKIICVGRISEIKNQWLLIKAIDVIVNKKKIKAVKVNFIGKAITNADKKYFYKINNLIAENNLEEHVNFIGSVPNNNLASFYNNADLSINLCPTGGMDKVVLESMSCGLPIIVLNKTFSSLFGIHGDKLILDNDNLEDLAKKIIAMIKTSKEKIKLIGNDLRSVVVKKHNVDDLVFKIYNEFKK